nr:Atu4866 domain-containing protein [Pseudanabaena sp. FACHB-2040]
MPLQLAVVNRAVDFAAIRLKTISLEGRNDTLTLRFCGSEHNSVSNHIETKQVLYETKTMSKILAVMISLGAFSLMSCTSQPTAEAPAPESSVGASAAESLSIAPSPQTSSNRQTMNPNQVNTEADQSNNLYVGMWVTQDGYIRHELLPNNRYDEARGDRERAYQGRYEITGNRINYWDDTGFTADGEFRDGVLYHGGYVFYRER